MSNITGRKIVKFSCKVLLWILSGIIGLIILFIIALQVPYTQHYLSAKASGYLSQKINSKVELDGISIVFPGYIELRNLYIEDLKQDTLLYSHSFKVDVDLMGLLSKKVTINSIQIDGLTGRVYREYPDTAYNYSFIITAFAGDKPKTEVSSDTTAPAWQISLNKIELKKCLLTYNDTISGIDVNLNLGEFITSFDEFDLYAKKLLLGKVQLINTTIDFVKTKSLQDEENEAKPFDYEIGVEKLLLKEVKFAYSDTEGKSQLTSDVSGLYVDVNRLDVKNEIIDLSSFILNGTEISYKQDKNSVVDSVLYFSDNQTSKAKSNWQIKLDKLDLNNNSFYYNNDNTVPLKEGVDFNHLSIVGFGLQSSEVYVSMNKIDLRLKNMQMKEKSGFVLRQFTSDIHFDTTQVELANLTLETAKSRISKYLSVQFKSLQNIKNSINDLRVKVNFDRTAIAMADVLLFVPGLRSNSTIANNALSVIHLNSKITGTVNNLMLESFELTTKQKTRIKLKGNLKNILEPQKMYADLPLIICSSSKEELYSFLPANSLPSSMSLPSTFDLKGDFKGYIKNFNSKVDLNTSMGEIKANVKMAPEEGNKETQYAVEISSKDFNIGELLGKQAEMGAVTMEATVKGQGFKMDTIKAELNAVIHKAVLKGYEYSNLKIDGTINKTLINGTVSIDDSNVAFKLDGMADINTNNPSYMIALDLEGADLQALHLIKEDVRVSMQLKADLNQKKDHNITGKAALRELTVRRGERKYSLDSMVFTSVEENGISTMAIRSEVISADVNGKILLSQLSQKMIQHLDSYFDIGQQAGPDTLQSQNFTFEVNIDGPVLLTENLLPAVSSPLPSKIKGEFNSEAHKLKIDLYVPQVVFNGISVDTLNLFIDSNKDTLDYSVQLLSLSNDIVKLENVLLEGGLHNNNLDFTLSSTKGKNVEMFEIGGRIKKQNGDFILKLNQKVNLNNTEWAVDSANLLQFTKNGLLANKMTLSGDQQSISINNPEAGNSNELEIKFGNFELATLSKIIEKKDDLIKGNLNGNIIIKKQEEIPGITADITLKNFVFNKMELGNIELHANNSESPQKYRTELSIKGNGNDVDVIGYYSTIPADNKLNFNIDIKNINVASIEPYTFGKVTAMTGTANGKISIKGDVSSPAINGVLNLKSTTFKPSIIDSYLKVDEGQIFFDSEKVRFESFTLYDSLNNKAMLNGYVDIQDLKKINFNLKLKTDNFLALNTSLKKNSLYYGKVYLDSDISIKGTPDLPKINLKARINKGTSLTYVKPESTVAENEGEGIVEFVVKDTVSRIMQREKEIDNTASAIKGIDLNAAIDFDKEAQLKMIVDQVSGDSVYVRGYGALEFNLDADGKTNLVGKYNITDGGYHLSIGDLVTKKFKIEPGSYVTWTGDILDAYADIKAIYTIKTSPVDLLEQQLAGLDELQKNKYRNLVTFLVYLKMAGFISTPVVSFDIQLPDEEKSVMNGAVNSKLNELRSDETQLNKQVFALLTINRFIGEDPLQSGGAPASLSATSRRSASRLLTQQLSALSAKYVKGVDLNLGVNSYEDYSSGSEEGRTQLQLGVSKQLFNDRVTVQVGGNVDIEGEKAKQNNASDIAGNIVVEYKLTDDGRYRLKAFRENEYENPIEGELTKTGGGIIYSRDYSRLRELFSTGKKKGKK